jgi:hypothetical protein
LGFAFIGWAEKRSFLYPLNTTDADGNPWKFASKIHEAIDRVTPRAPAAEMLSNRIDPSQYAANYSCGTFSVQFSPEDGSIISLIDRGGKQWASIDSPIAAFRYQTFTLEDFDIFNEEYNLPCETPCG